MTTTETQEGKKPSGTSYRELPYVRCDAGHHVHATQDEAGRWWVPNRCPACEAGAPDPLAALTPAVVATLQRAVRIMEAERDPDDESEAAQRALAGLARRPGGEGC